MIIPSRTSSPLLATAPHYARRLGLRCWISNKIIEFRGRRDSQQVPDSTGFLATTLALHRQVDQVAGQIDDSLRAQLQLIDREIANLFGQQQQLCSALTDARRHKDALVASHPSDGSLAADETERSIREVTATIDTLIGQINAAEAKIGNLAQQRSHLHGAARDIADTWSSRCDQLVALHRRGYLKRSTEPPPNTPRHTSKYEWAVGGSVPVPISLVEPRSPLQIMLVADRAREDKTSDGSGSTQ